ncbi:GGDEF domain-containing protein [Aliamphritea spongicola]|nr:GGDEF domain-containing protein [Aliamphritea spongicola]
MAHYDALTGLANRVLLYDRLGQAIEKARRDKAMLAVMFIDLDHFKRVNDSLGHRAGDRVLNAVAETLRQQVRQSDTVARISGDEFVVMFTDIQAVEHLAKVAGKMVAALERPLILAESLQYTSVQVSESAFSRWMVRMQSHCYSTQTLPCIKLKRAAGTVSCFIPIRWGRYCRSIC